MYNKNQLWRVCILTDLYYFKFQKSTKAQHDLELIKADSNIFHISWRRIQINSDINQNNIEKDTGNADESIVDENDVDQIGNILEDTKQESSSDHNINNNINEGRVQYPDSPRAWISRPSQCSVELHFDGNSNSVRYPGRPDRQSAVFRWIISERFCNLNRPLDIDHEQFEVLTRTFKQV